MFPHYITGPTTQREEVLRERKIKFFKFSLCVCVCVFVCVCVCVCVCLSLLQADKIDPNMALTYCGKGLVHMAKMSHSKTKMSMSRTADQWNEHLSQAGINFENACSCDRT